MSRIRCCRVRESHFPSTRTAFRWRRKAGVAGPNYVLPVHHFRIPPRQRIWRARSPSSRLEDSTQSPPTGPNVCRVSRRRSDEPGDGANRYFNQFDNQDSSEANNGQGRRSERGACPDIHRHGEPGTLLAQSGIMGGSLTCQLAGHGS